MARWSWETAVVVIVNGGLLTPLNLTLVSSNSPCLILGMRIVVMLLFSVFPIYLLLRCDGIGSNGDLAHTVML